MFPKVTLVLGGVSSGKSAFAERLVLSAGGMPVYLASAEPRDDEMSGRIARHRDMRGAGWTTIEEPLKVVDVLARMTDRDVVLFDCATLWLSNHLMADSDLVAERSALIAALNSCAAPVVVVSNEVGLGGVAENAMARQFADAQGRLNQGIAASADTVVSVMAGLPMVLKGSLPQGVT